MNPLPTIDAEYKHTTTGDVVTVVDILDGFVQVFCEAQSRYWFVDRDRFQRWFRIVAK